MAALGNRNFTARKNVFDIYNNRELLRRFRLDKGGIEYVTDMLSDNLEPVTARNHAMSPLDKVLVTLRFLATGKMQLCNADDMELSQPSVSRAVTQTLSAINDPRIVKRFISFPLTQRQVMNNALDFASVANFPNVVGVIDGTHVQILAPHVNEPAFVNRKHYHTINTQIVFDADYRILDIVAKWPGSTHDSRILRESGLQVLFETGRVPPNAHLLGDSGYPSKTWLLTPYLRPNNAVQHAYNRSHKRTRSIVERGIGQLKRRFHALHVELRLSPQKACQVIVACAILHNICKMRNIPEPEESSDSPPNSQPDTIPHLPSSNRSSTATSGVSYRDQFSRLHFSCELKKYPWKLIKYLFE